MVSRVSPVCAGGDVERIDALSVVIPAHNEQEHIAACLDHLYPALRCAMRALPSLTVRVVIVLDACADQTALMVERGLAGWEAQLSAVVTTMTASYACVGASRALGAAKVMSDARASGLENHRHWVAFTDADTQVPKHWLMSHIGHAEGGADVLLGTVEPGPGLTDAERETWFARHTLGSRHPYVYGANLGVRGCAYDAIGGFSALAAHEDVDLVARLRTMAGTNVVAHDDARVITSARLTGRVSGGFATYLTGLSRDVRRENHPC